MPASEARPPETAANTIQPETGYSDNVPDTPSPKKNRIGGSGRALYGRIACDLSCP